MALIWIGIDGGSLPKILSPVTGFLSMRGRADRFEWWWLSLSGDVIAQVCLVVLALRLSVPPGEGLALNILLGLAAVIAIWVTVAVTCRRLRSRGRSPWWASLLLVPYLGYLWLVVDCGILPDPGRTGKRKVVRRVVQSPHRPS